MKASVSVTLLALVLMGCTATRSLPVVSTNNLAPSYPPSRQRVTGEDCVYNVFGIPISYNNDPSVHRAIDNAASMTPYGFTMSDITIHRDILITLVYNEVVSELIAMQSPRPPEVAISTRFNVTFTGTTDKMNSRGKTSSIGEVRVSTWAKHPADEAGYSAMTGK